MKHPLYLLAVLLRYPAILVSSFASAASQPNIIIHFIDDLGYGDIGPFGAVKQKTPHLDRMAREGMRLTSFYAAPVCSVSRAQIMTGCYGARVSVPGVYPPGAKNGLHPDEHTIADRLKPLGYATQCIGKWHLGDQSAFLPTMQGFDHYLGIPYSNDMFKTSSVDGRRVVPLMRDDKVERLLDEADQDRIEEICTDEAVKFIHSSKDKPFFLYFPHTAVHTPIHPGKAFQGSSQNGRFGDWVQEVDASVGRVFDTLRELQLDRNTLVIFTSDNGGPVNQGADNTPLRGAKGSTLEGGIRVCTLAWWPGKVAAGSETKAITAHMDLLPTFGSLARCKAIDEMKLDGVDISPVLLGKDGAKGHDVFHYYRGFDLQAVRSGPWKLHLAQNELYNLDDDIGEANNVAAQHADIVVQLQKHAETMRADLGDKTKDAPGVRALGRVANPQPLIAPDGTVREGFNKIAKNLP